MVIHPATDATAAVRQSRGVFYESIGTSFLGAYRYNDPQLSAWKQTHLP